MLCCIDKVSADRIGPNNVSRIKRALEVCMQTGRPLSDFKVPDKPRRKYKFKIFAIYREKQELAKRISRRLDAMFEGGLASEVEGLRKLGLTLRNQSMNSIGYKEFFLFDDIREIKEAIRMDTVHYAKRQMTFFRSLNSKLTPVKWIRLKGES